MYKRRPNGTFLPNNVPWNKGRYGYMGANSGSITKETVVRSDYKPKIYRNGAEIQIALKDKYIKVKSRNGKEYLCHKRVSYPRYVMEQAGYEVPSNCVVWHKDGNPLNNNLDNLEILTRSELIQKNRKDRRTK